MIIQRHQNSCDHNERTPLGKSGDGWPQNSNRKSKKTKRSRRVFMTNDQKMRSRHQFLPRIENQLFCAGKMAEMLPHQLMEGPCVRPAVAPAS
jgi:hypothetical protein